MKLRKLGILGLSASMIGAAGMALANTGAKEIKAANETKLILTHQQEKYLNIFAKKMGESKNDYYAYLNDWLNDPFESSGLNYFNNFNEEQTDFSYKEIEIAKNSFYFDTLLVTYLFDKTSSVDIYRMYLDHFVPLKDPMNAACDYCYYEVIAENTSVAHGLCSAAYQIYEGLTETLVCTYDFPVEMEIEEQVAAAYADFKAFLVDQSNYLKTNPDVTINPFNTYLSIAKATNTITHVELSKLENIANSFVQSYIDEDDASTLLGYNQADLDLWLSDEVTYQDQIVGHFDTALNVLFYYFKTFQYIELVCPDNFDGFKLVNNNIGPSMYKMLDLLEAIRGDEATNIPDYPNVLILALETLDDTNHLLDLFMSDVNNIIKTDINKFSALEDASYIEWKDDQLLKTNNAVAAFDAVLAAYKADGKFDEAIKGCDDAEKECTELLEELTIERETLKFMSPDMDYILRVVNDLQMKAYVLRKDVAYDRLVALIDALSDEFAELANIEVDTVETYDALDEDLSNLWVDVMYAAVEANSLSEKYSEKKFKDLLIDADVFVIQVLDTMLEKHDDIMRVIDNEINAGIDSINGKADLIYSLMDEENCDVRKLLEEAADLTTGLSRIINTIGEYEEILGTESVLEALKEKEEMEYAKVSALIDNLRGLQKERAIESIASRGAGLVEGATYLVENEGTVRECDAFIEQIEVLIREIDDNYEILGQDERLSQTKAKLNESLNDLNELKDSINSAHTRNIVLIVVGSVFGAALFFVGGFFLAKFLAKKQRKEA